jgi:hypothetical protein
MKQSQAPVYLQEESHKLKMLFYVSQTIITITLSSDPKITL